MTDHATAARQAVIDARAWLDQASNALEDARSSSVAANWDDATYTCCPEQDLLMAIRRAAFSTRRAIKDLDWPPAKRALGG